MSFIQPCFIRKNTPELRNKLRELGYNELCNGNDGWFIPMNKLPYLVTYPWVGSYMGTTGYWYDTNIDCGENEELFLALAALRDDKPDYQWFVWDDDGVAYNKFKQYIPGEPWEDWWWFEVHKATVEEIIEYFKEI